MKCKNYTCRNGFDIQGRKGSWTCPRNWTNKNTCSNSLLSIGASTFDTPGIIGSRRSKPVEFTTTFNTTRWLYFYLWNVIERVKKFVKVEKISYIFRILYTNEYSRSWYFESPSSRRRPRRSRISLWARPAAWSLKLSNSNPSLGSRMSRNYLSVHLGWRCPSRILVIWKTGNFFFRKSN